MADCMQFLQENRLIGCQMFGRFGSLKTESEQNSVFRTSLTVIQFSQFTAETFQIQFANFRNQITVL